MRRLAAALLAALFLTAVPAARADHDPYLGTVDHWYTQYLGRHVDPQAYAQQSYELRNGTPVIVAESRIMASPEYYARHGSNDRAFVQAVIQDAGGSTFYLDHYLRRLYMLGSREALALEVLNQTRNPAPSPAAAPQPYVVETYRPTYAAPACPPPVYTPTVVTRPVYSAPVVAYPPPVYATPSYPAYPVRTTWLGAGYRAPGYNVGFSVVR